MLAAEIAEYLDAQGVGVWDPNGATGNIFVASLPDTPDECISIYPRPGAQGDLTLYYDRTSIQFLVRGTQDPRWAEETAQAIYNLLTNFHDARFIASGLLVFACMPTTMPAWIGRDANARHEFSLNVNIEVYNPDRRV